MHFYRLPISLLRTGLLVASVAFIPGCGPWAGQWENWGNSRKDAESSAMHLAPAAFVYEQVQLQPDQPFQALPGQSIELGGRQWVAARGQQRIPDRLLAPVGNAGGVPVFRLAWDDAPYDQLYVQRSPGIYSELH
jgi:hypothetical protein